MFGAVTEASSLSPAPILAAAESYRGTIFDLDANRAVGPDAFARARTALTRELRRNGLAPGDRVLLAVSNGPLFIAALTAILACEGSPLVVHAKTPPAELQRYADRFGVRFLASEAGENGPAAGLESPVVEVACGDLARLHWSLLPMDDSKLSGPLLRGVPLHPTSGSTGLPKIALRPGFAALEEARHYAETMSIDASDRIVAMPPMSHAYGYGMCVMVPLLTGASLVTTQKFDAKQLQQVLLEHEITILPTVPAMLDVLLFGGALNVQHLRWALAAGAVLPKRSADAFRAKFGVTFCPLYGTTETGGISVATAADGQDVDGRVGPAMQGVQVAIWPSSDGTPGETELGKVMVRSSSMMHGYLDDAGQITQPLIDGWFETGDLARTTADPSLWLRGRNSEVINVAGLKVVPCEVEEVISTLAGVREVRVYAGQHRTGTQFVKAAVAVENSLSMEAIRRHCEQQLVYYKRPHTITLVAALPRNAAGKIIRDQLP